ncbi:MAG: 50S ribosomal protein L11 methyltransferase [Proteobacteria bacterium]|nr:50S ribosomal protein L11 methyltransferase [Pseudomonadota bacterium]
MKQPSPAYKTRVEILVEKGIEELLPEELYALSNSGIWIEEKGSNVLIKCYPENIKMFLDTLNQLKIPVVGVDMVKEELQDYAELTRKYFRPIKIENIMILPPWSKNRYGKRPIIIEPGMAFGTGRHESTKLMFKLMKLIDIKDKKVLDIGCGSGILSLYAHLLGAKKITAIDNDIDTVLSAKKNISLNHMRNIELICTDIQDIHGTYDIILANLDIRTFTDHSQKIMDLVKKHGYIIISGVLGRDKKSILPLFRPFPPIKVEKKNSWIGFIFKIDNMRYIG